MTECYVATASGARIDQYIAEITELSRSAAAKLIENGDITVNGTPVSKKYAVKEGDSIEVTLPDPEFSEAIAEDIPLNIVFEDDDIIVINKPSGMVVHPAPGNYTGTLVNALLYHCRDSLSGIGGVMRPGIVHRIDKDTSGLLVVAKNDAAHKALSEQLEGHRIVREYHAIAKGCFKESSGTVNAPIGRHPVDRKKMAVHKDTSQHAKEAITHYELLASYNGASYLKLKLETGRTHQIRVHMAYLGHPLMGDEVYGSVKTRFEKTHPSILDGQLLHAKRLSFKHPSTGEEVEFECELPDNFKKALRLLENETDK